VSSPRVLVVDYGMGNRRSAVRALERVGAATALCSDPRQLEGADGLLLPGVGAFPAAVAELRARGLYEPLCRLGQEGMPLLGACLGMQLLFEYSSEQGGAHGLGLLEGTVRPLAAGGLKLPHIGWTAVEWIGHGGRPPGWPLAVGLPNPTFLYHVHSYVVAPADQEVVLGVAEYGERFVAAVGQGAVFGTQSHPEKSSRHGLQLLANFVAFCAGQAQRGGEREPVAAG
jgi:glutamine amidotransferase